MKGAGLMQPATNRSITDHSPSAGDTLPSAVRTKCVILVFLAFLFWLPTSISILVVPWTSGHIMATGKHDLAFEAESSPVESVCPTAVEREVTIDHDDWSSAHRSDQTTAVYYHCAFTRSNWFDNIHHGSEVRTTPIPPKIVTMCKTSIKHNVIFLYPFLTHIQLNSGIKFRIFIYLQKSMLMMR